MGIGGTAQLSSNGDSGGSWSSSNTLIAKVNSSSGLVTGEDAGSATITYTKTASPCSDATATYAVTVTTTNVSVQAGNWSSGSSWGTGSKPTGAQNIQISHNITVDETTADLGNLTIDNGATVTVGGFELEVSGTTDINGTLSMQALSTVDIDGNFDATGGAVTFTGAGTLELAGNVTSLGAFTSASGSKVHYNGGAQTIVAASAKNAAYEDLEFSGGPKTLEGNTTVSDDLIFSEDYDLITAGHILSIKKTPTGYSDSRLIRRSSSTADVTVKFINATSGSAAECIIPVGVDGDLREVGILPENTGTETYTVIYKNGSPYNGGVLNWGWGTSGTGSPINSAADAAHVNNVYYYEIDRDNSIDAKLKFLQFSGLIYTPSGSERHIMHWDGNEWDQLASSSSGNGVVTTNYINNFSPFTHGSSGSALPIDLVSFKAECKGEKVEINFKVASQVNNDFFSIYRSSDNLEWSLIGEIPGQGNSSTQMNYTWTDYNPNSETNYYQLVQTDFDGKIEEFAPISVVCNNEIKGDYSVYPNPINNYLLIDLDLDNYDGETSYIQLLDINGKLIKQKVVSLNRGISHLELDFSDVNKGVYFLQFIGLNTTLGKTRIVKQ